MSDSWVTETPRHLGLGKDVTLFRKGQILAFIKEQKTTTKEIVETTNVGLLTVKRITKTRRDSGETRVSKLRADIQIFTVSSEVKQYFGTVLGLLRQAGLTANPKKCAAGCVGVQYLGFHLGHGQVHPQINMTAVIVQPLLHHFTYQVL